MDVAVEADQQHKSNKNISKLAAGKRHSMLPNLTVPLMHQSVKQMIW